MSGKGVDAACDGGVYPCVPIGFGCGEPRGWDNKVFRVLFKMISFVFLMYMPCRARSFRLVWIKFVCCVSGDPSWRRASRNRWTWLLLVRWTSISLASDLRLLRKKVFMLFPCRWCGRYRVWAGSVFVRASLERIVRWTRLSTSLHREWGGCDGRGLKFMSEFSSVLWMYAVVSLLRCRLVMLFSLVMMLFFVMSLLGVVLPCMLM